MKEKAYSEKTSNITNTTLTCNDTSSRCLRTFSLVHSCNAIVFLVAVKFPMSRLAMTELRFGKRRRKNWEGLNTLRGKIILIGVSLASLAGTSRPKHQPPISWSRLAAKSRQFSYFSSLSFLLLSRSVRDDRRWIFRGEKRWFVGENYFRNVRQLQ